MTRSQGNVGLVILAAGASTRMGKPKQLLAVGETNLIGHTIKVGLDSECDPVVVVLGSQSRSIKKTITETAVEIVENDHWEEGMSSSLRVGLERMLALKEVPAVLVMVCDQPGVDSELLNGMIKDFDNEELLGVACTYGDVVGVPALFGEGLFSDLLSLSGDKGARALIKNYIGQFKLIPFPKGAEDIDTPSDYQRFTSKLKDKK